MNNFEKIQNNNYEEKKDSDNLELIELKKELDQVETFAKLDRYTNEDSKRIEEIKAKIAKLENEKSNINSEEIDDNEEDASEAETVESVIIDFDHINISKVRNIIAEDAELAQVYEQVKLSLLTPEKETVKRRVVISSMVSHLREQKNSDLLGRFVMILNQNTK
jgi:hypothetical protein